MQEIALLLSSLAGVATAAVVKKIPRGRQQLLSLGASSHIRKQIDSLKIEKDILTKTITQLYQTDEYPKIYRSKLLSQYQHQLGMILAKLEKLEQASRHPDLGPVGDGLITLMDQKLSRLDDRLYELSSRIAVAGDTQRTKNIKKSAAVPETRKIAPEHKFDFEKPIRTTDDTEASRQSFELTTLTAHSLKKPRFQLQEKPTVMKPVTPKMNQNTISDVPEQEKHIALKPAITKTTESPSSRLTKDVAIAPPVDTSTSVTDEVLPSADPTSQSSKESISTNVTTSDTNKLLPDAETQKSDTTLDDDLDADLDELAKIKGDIQKVMSKIDQTEVE